MSDQSKETIKSPKQCATMLDVRAGVDDIDRQLVELLGTRFGYMKAAARIKPARGDVRDEVRKAYVIEKAIEHGRKNDVPDGFIDGFWDRLVEYSIAHEFELFDQK